MTPFFSAEKGESITIFRQRITEYFENDNRDEIVKAHIVGQFLFGKAAIWLGKQRELDHAGVVPYFSTVEEFINRLSISFPGAA